MGAVERNGYVFEPEFSVIEKNGAIHVYHKGEFIEEVRFSFSGNHPELDQIEGLIDEYCEKRGI
jgi:hypothetical protein